ncbi:TrbI F-type domain-containing protein [Sphingomonas lacusdianchii]|uniref:TrbI F-type domain-containing protein n=1 Tax=Sphingomonas lacusdianchii TaxID=2917992 RepID=UPI001F55F3E5|nr:TrbI F-type domain-containing protein [Sphingomonas sp. JXJ CY 53]
MTDMTEALRAEPAVAGAPADAAKPVAKVRRTVFAGYTAGQLVLFAAMIALVVWGMWVTRALTSEPPQRIVKADLSRIVGDYVQAQARSATPPDQVQAQMRQFMASLDNELQRRGAKGQVVLVGEAVLSKSVTDITPEVVSAVYASGVKRPQPASQEQMSQMMRAVPAAAAQQAVPVVPMPTAAQAPVEQGAFGPAPVAPADPAFAAPGMAGASVSSFGGPDGAGAQ